VALEIVRSNRALRWARETHPNLTDKIDGKLLSRLDDLWNSHAPLSDFEATLDELIRVHAEVGSLFSGQRTSENDGRKP
jgi:hypothetical protein